MRSYSGRTCAAVITALLVALVPPVAAKSEPLQFVRRDVQKRGPQTTEWGGVAGGREKLRRLWDRFEQEGAPPRVRFGKKVAILAGTGQSSSCPTRLLDLRLRRERKRVVVRVYAEDPGQGGGCTDDWVPKTFTVVVERADLQPPRPRRLDVRLRRVADPDG
ncbi:MAG TPA: hypothetical protein VG318_12480 [Actinomycetota bacterium]|nr:hypothetical protein [Actinomycetota bacterium]